MDTHDPGQLRAWLTHTVRPALDELRAAPLDMQRGYTAITTIYQYHEELFYSATRAGKAPAASLVEFRDRLANQSPVFATINSAVHAEAGQTLRYTNILSSSGMLDPIAPRGTVHRAIVVAKFCQQLIPLLDNLMSFYGRLLDAYEL